MIRTDLRQHYQTARDILLDIEALRSQSESTHLLTQVLPEVVNNPPWQLPLSQQASYQHRPLHLHPENGG